MSPLPLWPALALAAFAGVACAAPGLSEGPQPQLLEPARPARRTPRATSADTWLNLISEYTREGGAAAGGAGDWFPRPVPVMLPIGGGGALPMLVLPVPVPTRAADSECSAKPATQAVPDPPRKVIRKLVSRQPARLPSQQPHSPERADTTVPAPAPAPPAPRGPPPAAKPSLVDEPSLRPAGSPQRLVELFRSQQPTAPHLPPMLIAIDSDDDDVDVRPAPPSPPPAPRAAAPPAPRVAAPPAPTPVDPPRPRFNRSMMLRGELTVPRADYTESYVAWWDASSGAARVDYFSGGTSTYRMLPGDGTVRRAEVRVDRTGERHVMRCAVSEPRRASLGDRAPPALPDLELFSFAGYAEREGALVELWRHTAAGRGGELGAVRGELLTFRHELELRRVDDAAVPVKYTLSVDSSVLGADCEGYEHRYTDVRFGQPDAALLRLNLEEVCEVTELSDEMERLEPLREFTMMHRDPAYDSKFERFQRQHGRDYVNDVERAVRKTLLVQHLRFVNAGNRMGSTALLGNNHLGDRLDAELRALLGVDPRGVLDTLAAGRADAASAPQQDARLPHAFDWRERGAVSSVRDQGSCRSCWAFAVAGSVEGALFLRTGQLTPLSEQQLVDCAHPYGGHGCRGTWPSAAYDYVQYEGLNARDHYLPYLARETKPCLAKNFSPATRISGHVNVTQHSVRALKVAVRRHAPTVVIVDGSPKSFIFQEAGVLADNRCAKSLDKLNHAVLAVGWGEQRGSPYFILKNSWSGKWGDKGYIKLDAASNTCGVLTAPSYPVLEQGDVVQPADDARAA